MTSPRTGKPRGQCPTQDSSERSWRHDDARDAAPRVGGGGEEAAGNERAARGEPGNIWGFLSRPFPLTLSPAACCCACCLFPPSTPHLIGSLMLPFAEPALFGSWTTSRRRALSSSKAAGSRAALFIAKPLGRNTCYDTFQNAPGLCANLLYNRDGSESSPSSMWLNSPGTQSEMLSQPQPQPPRPPLLRAMLPMRSSS